VSFSSSFSSSVPLVSVVIPTHNRIRLVTEAVGSVLAQTFRDFELIVADDGSDDGTRETLASMGFSRIESSVPAAVQGRPAGPAGEDRPPASADPRLLYLPLVRGGTPGRTRNRGAALARGRYLAFLDSDDLWESRKLERQITLFPGTEAGIQSAPGTEAPRIAHTRELWLRNGGEVSQKGQKHRREGDIFADSLVKCIIGPSTVMLERSLFEEFGGFREDLEIAEDYELWLRITCRENVAYLDEPLTIKRAGSGDQLSEKHGQIEIFRIQALRALVDGGFFTRFSSSVPGSAAGPGSAGNPGSREAISRRELARKCRIYAAGCRKRGKIAEAEEYETLAAAGPSG
jgi:glycosyltransferase involved in cell wall biosynthesis